jgi:hypothetical protein
VDVPANFNVADGKTCERRIVYDAVTSAPQG